MVDNKKVFISYSWTVQERVVELAERLIANGIDVVLDVYDLKEGQDKYAFMEQSVNNDTIDRVLIICDRTYAEKANNREGGVGDETVIISQEVYGQVKQEKFIPIIFEVDENNKAYCPHYIKSRIYIDLSTEDDRYETEYEKLLRNIYEKPLFKKPALGSRPEWLENDAVDLSALRDIVRQIRGYTGDNTAKADFLLRKGIEQFVEAAKSYEQGNIDSLLSVIDTTKSLRDVFVDFCEALISSSMEISNTICALIETLYNELHDATGKGCYLGQDFELYDYIIWEMLITCTAILLHYEKFKALNEIVCHTYFLKDSYFSSTVKPYSYYKFRKYFRAIETRCKHNTPFKNTTTLAGKILVERERKPILTKEALANADIVLYQLGDVLGIKDDESNYWFPTSYVYHDYEQPMWQKLKSKEYCKKVMPLFGANTIEELKSIIEKQPYDRNMSYPRTFFSAPTILSVVKSDEIGTLN